MLRTRDVMLTETKGQPVKVKIFANEKVHEMWILGCEDGRVIFGKDASIGGRHGRWCLPIDYVKERGELMK